MKRLISSLLALVMIFCCFSSAVSAAIDPAKKVWRIQAKVGSTNISNSTGGLISTYYVLTKAQEGHIAPRDYTGVSGTSAVQYLMYGQESYFPLVGKDNAAVTDEEYVAGTSFAFEPLTGNTLDYGDDFTLSIRKENSTATARRYYLVISVADQSAASDGKLYGTIYLSNPNFDPLTLGTGTYDGQMKISINKVVKPNGVVDNSRVTGINSNILTMGQEGYVAARDYTGVKGTASPSYFQYGKTSYFTLKDGNGTTVKDDRYVNPAGISAQWSAGGEYVDRIELVRARYGTSDDTKYYLAITMKESDTLSTQLTGTVTLTHTTPPYGYGTADGTITLAIDHLLRQAPSQKQVTGVVSTLPMTMAPEGYVAARDWTGVSGTSVSYAAYGKTLWFTLKDGNGTVVTDERYVENYTVDLSGLTSGSEYIEKVEIQKAYYNSSKNKQKYYLTVTAIEDPSAGEQRISGSIQVSKDHPDFGFNAKNSMISLEIDMPVKSYVEPDPRRVIGVNSALLQVMGNEGYVAARNYTGVSGSSATDYFQYGATTYFNLKDSNGSIVSDDKYVNTAGVSAQWSSGGEYVEKVALVKERYSTGKSKKYYLAITMKSSVDPQTQLTGTVTLIHNDESSGYNTANGVITVFIDRLLRQPPANDQVTGIVGTLPMIMTPEGYIAARDWEGIPGTPSPSYLGYGKTLYFTLKDSTDTVVTDERYIEGYEVDLSGLTGGSEHLESVEIKKAYYDSNKREQKYYLAITAIDDPSLGNQRLEGTIRIKNDDPEFGFNAAESTISLSLDLPVGSPLEGRVQTVGTSAQCEYKGVVFHQTISGESSTSVTSIPYGYTAYYPLRNESGGDVTASAYVEDIEISHTFDPELVADVSIVKKRYYTDSADTKYFVSVTFVEQTDESKKAVATGKIILKKGDGSGEHDVVGGEITSKTITMTLTVSEPEVRGTPTEGDSRRLFSFMRLGTDKKAIWPLVENEEGRPDRYENAYGLGQAYSNTTTPVITGYNTSIYYMLADCQGRPMTDLDYVEDIRITADFDSYGNYVNGIRIVKKRLEDGIPVNGVLSDNLYCYFLEISFVDRDIVYRVPVTGTVTLSKRGKKGIAREDHELELDVEVYVGMLDATLYEHYHNRENFSERILSSTPTRYKFKNPSYEDGGDYNNLGTDAHDVIYLNDEQDAYFTVSTLQQGTILLACSDVGEPFLYDLYGTEAELKFIMGNGAHFLRFGILTIEQPDDGWCLYKVEGGLLTEAKEAVFDEARREWNIRTRDLGQYCLSDRELDLDLQYTTEIDPYQYVPKGMSPHKPTRELDIEVMNQAFLENPKVPLVQYVLSEVSIGAAVSRWMAERLENPVQVVSQRGWTISIDPKTIPETVSRDQKLSLHCINTDHSVVVRLFEQLEDATLEYPMEIMVRHSKLGDLKNASVYGKSDSGIFVDLGKTDLSGGSAQFSAVSGIRHYLITDLKFDAVSLEQYQNGLDA